FRAGDRFKYLPITTIADGVGAGESDRQLTVELSDPDPSTGVNPGRMLGTGTIKNSDGITNEFLVGTSIIPETDLCSGVPCKATAKITVSLPGGKPGATVSVHYTTHDAGAHGVKTGTNADYNTKSGTLTFLAGGTWKKYLSVTTLGNINPLNPPNAPFGIDFIFDTPTPGWTVSGNGHVDILDND